MNVSRNRPPNINKSHLLINLLSGNMTHFRLFTTSAPVLGLLLWRLSNEGTFLDTFSNALLTEALLLDALSDIVTVFSCPLGVSGGQEAMASGAAPVFSCPLCVSGVGEATVSDATSVVIETFPDASSEALLLIDPSPDDTIVFSWPPRVSSRTGMISCLHFTLLSGCQVLSSVRRGQIFGTWWGYGWRALRRPQQPGASQWKKVE